MMERKRAIVGQIGAAPRSTTAGIAAAISMVAMAMRRSALLQRFQSRRRSCVTESGSLLRCTSEPPRHAPAQVACSASPNRQRHPLSAHFGCSSSHCVARSWPSTIQEVWQTASTRGGCSSRQTKGLAERQTTRIRDTIFLSSGRLIRSGAEKLPRLCSEPCLSRPLWAGRRKGRARRSGWQSCAPVSASRSHL